MTESGVQRWTYFLASWVLAIEVIAISAGAAETIKPFTLNDDGGWCWFQDERVLVLRQT